MGMSPEIKEGLEGVVSSSARSCRSTGPALVEAHRRHIVFVQHVDCGPRKATTSGISCRRLGSYREGDVWTTWTVQMPRHIGLTELTEVDVP